MILLIIKQKIREHWKSWLIIEGVAFLLIMPQWLSKSMIFGSDILFHFNRFYDVAQQIENQNFQYFMSQYGFQQSGRIVNALYGPLMAYFNGFLVWLSPSWFIYQNLANLILFGLAGHSMYLLLKRSQVIENRALQLSIIYMTSFSILYWVTRQGFTSWGAAIFPLCLWPMVRLYEEKHFNSWQVGFLMALMFQVHLFSAVLLAVVYLGFYGTLFAINKAKRGQLFIQGVLSVLLFFLLTTNVWYGLLTLYSGNELLAPFVNHLMYQSTITYNSVYWLVTPGVLLLFVGYFIWFSRRKWHELLLFDKVIVGVGLFFLILSTNLIPWRLLMEQNWKIIETIQFPFRFFVPFTVLLLIFIGRNGQVIIKKKDRTTKVLTIAMALALVQTILLTGYFCLVWQLKEQPIEPSLHTYLYTEDSELLKRAVFSGEKQEILLLVQKSTPDYLPIYQTDQFNKYKQYKELIIDQNQGGEFTKEVIDGSLVVTWQARLNEEVPVPVVIYDRTQVWLNQRKMPHQELDLTTIGTPKVTSKEGENTLILAYSHSKYLSIALAIPMITLILMLGYRLVKIKD